MEIGQRGEVAVFVELETDFFIDAGFGFDVFIADKVAGTTPVEAAWTVVEIGVGGALIVACAGASGGTVILCVGVVPAVVFVDGAAVAGIGQHVVGLGLV